jgi:NAD(P)-dependent dehydrogenase (short-subunit alcohol dehydrogenase family)
MSYDLKDKVIWLTGASKGIGYHLAKALARAGAKLALSARDTTQITDIPDALLLDCDVTDKANVKDVVDQIVKQYGGLDCIVLNAGNAEYVEVSNFDADIYQRMIDVNFMSQVNAVEICLPYLRESDAPYIVAMSSSVAWQGLSRGHAYSASKAASRNFFEGLALDLSKESIPVSIICPGFVRTPLTDKNDFPMPGRIEPDDAAERIVRGMRTQKSEIHFPKRFTWVLKFISFLPAGLRFNLLKRIV